MLLQKDTKFIWGKDQQCAFDELKQRLITAPILIYPDLTKPFIVQTDASNEAIGAVLSQVGDDGKEHPLAYISRALTRCEQNYSTTEKECLAVVHACEQFRPYLYGSKVVIVTDHAPLQWLKNNKDTSSRLIRWSLKLQDLNMEIVYKPGKSHTNADAMSRWIYLLTLDKSVQEEQQLDRELAVIIKKIKPPFEMVDGKLMYKSDEVYKVVVPKAYRAMIMYEAHDGLLGAHMGFKRTLKRIQQKYFWPGMIEEIKMYCKACSVCQEGKTPAKYGRQPLRPITVNGVFERVAMDVLGPLPNTHQGNTYILVIQEYLTKWPIAVPLPDQKASTIAQALVEQLFLVYGAPRVLLTDRGTNFMSNVLREVNEFWGVKQSFTTPYHPQTDGMVERFNRTLAKLLASHVDDNQRNWDVILPYVVYAYRTTVHEVTKETPFFLMYGRDPVTPLDNILSGEQHFNLMEDPDYKEKMIHSFRVAWTKASQNIEKAQLRAQSHYKEHPVRYKIGDLVRVHSPHIARGKVSKLNRPWKGP
jgi:hypothetical protein